MNICRGDLTDIEYLEHMIPHHQVAVDISKILRKKTRSAIMHDILRKLIWTQNYEIQMMMHILKNFPNKVSSNIELDNNYKTIVSDFIKPNSKNISKTYCDPYFFDREGHLEHIKKMNIDDKMYIEHMIPHHQVAVDMSKKLLKNTENDFMIYLANRIIVSQQHEIVILSDLLKSNVNFNSFNLVVE